jgi:P-type Cu2+ transporter
MQTGEVYFDSITMFLFFITLSKYLELRARHQSTLIIQQLTHQQPDWAARFTNGDWESVPVNALQNGDLVLVKTGAAIPVDGIVREGNSEVSETLLSGEANPKIKQPGDLVIAGSINISHPLQIQATRVGDETTLASILKLYERAQYDKPRIVNLTQRFSHYFILFQLLTVAAMFCYWLPTSPAHAFWVVISILVITCPCALAIATPIGLTAAMNVLSRHGFLCTRGHVLESMAATTDIIFDKTGTLTQGYFSIESIETFTAMTEREVLQIAASLESQSEHPIASAFKMNDYYPSCTAVTVHPNLGIEGTVNEQHYFLGNLAFIQLHCNEMKLPQLSASTHTTVYLATHHQSIARFELADKIRESTASVIQYLLQQHYRLHLLSGDHITTVKSYADTLGIQNYHAHCSPQDKLNYVKKLQQQGARVVMVGDGINDAPVLMQAEVSIAMAAGADLTRISADAVLLKNDIAMLIKTFDHAKKAQRIIRQCLIWALLYNIICLPLAVSGMIAPYIAAILMSLSSILVVSNALRLLSLKKSEALCKSSCF